MRCLPLEFPGLRVTRVVVGNTMGTDFASSWDPDALEAAVGAGWPRGSWGSVDPIRPRGRRRHDLARVGSPAHVDDVAVLDHEPRPS